MTAQWRVLTSHVWTYCCYYGAFVNVRVYHGVELRLWPELSINQSINHLFAHNTSMKQFQFEHIETSRTARHQVHLWLPL